MARIPENEIERLKNEVSVERLIESSGIALKPGSPVGWARFICPRGMLTRVRRNNQRHCAGCWFFYLFLFIL